MVITTRHRVIITAMFLLAGCGGAEFVNTANLPDNNYCNHMQEVCKEAREFEAAYNRLPPGDKKDAESILKAYRLQCNDALKTCKKSAGNR